jgi:rare lipoprotein A
MRTIPLPRIAGRAAAVALALAAGACAYDPKPGDNAFATPATRTYIVGQPYQAQGRWYHPQEDWRYDRRGLATWIGPENHGRRTASGEPYDANALTAAHPTLPLPSIVRVTNLDNGRSIELRVNDRGAHAPDRVIDVSRRAAEYLGFRDQGVARVRVQNVADKSLALKRAAGGEDYAYAPPPARRPLPPASPRYDAERYDRYGTAAEPRRNEPRRLQAARPDDLGRLAPGGRSPDSSADRPRGSGRLYIQTGAYTERERAEEARRALTDVGPTRISEVFVNDGLYYRVRIGPLRDGAQVDRVLARVNKRGYRDARIVTD